MFNVKNSKNQYEFSMKIVTFNSYTNIKFKKALH